jgi:hypothetical protein
VWKPNQVGLVDEQQPCRVACSCWSSAHMSCSD